jgi:hypothetical protein
MKTDNNKKFCFVDQDSKKQLRDIASLFGVSVDLVKTVYEYNFFAFLMKALDTKTQLKTLKVPMVGTIGIRPSKTEPGEFDTFFSLDENFKETYKKILNGDVEELNENLEKTKMKSILSNS